VNVPAAIAKLIVAGAAKYGLESAVVAGLAAQESSFDTRATRFEPGWRYWVTTDGVPCGIEEVRGIPIDFNGAQEHQGVADAREVRHQATSWGLLQVMGGVAREHGFRWADLSVMKLNASLALDFGLKHFTRFMHRHELVDAISAYNAGEGGIGSNPEYVAKVTAYITVFREQGLAA
jgi:soluble lytic murein transglycosylase-like protein